MRSTGQHRNPNESIRPSIGYLDIQIPHRSDVAKTVSRAESGSSLAPPQATHGGCAVGSILDDFGQLGAASGLAAVAKAAVCLRNQIIPASRGSRESLVAVAAQLPPLFVPGRPAILAEKSGGRPAPGGGLRFGPGRFIGRGDPRRIRAGGRRGGSRNCDLSKPQHRATAGSSCCKPTIKRALALASKSSSGSHVKRRARTSTPWRGAGGICSRAIRQLPFATAIVADGIESLKHLLEIASARSGDYRLEGAAGTARSMQHTLGRPLQDALSLAFVYPGLGNHFAGMGRELSAIWPDVLRNLDGQSASLRDQLEPALWWGADSPASFVDHRVPILGSVWVGSFVTEILQRFGVRPRAAIGYSHG